MTSFSPLSVSSVTAACWECGGRLRGRCGEWEGVRGRTGGLGGTTDRVLGSGGAAGACRNEEQVEKNNVRMQRWEGFVCTGVCVCGYSLLCGDHF